MTRSSRAPSLLGIACAALLACCADAAAQDDLRQRTFAATANLALRQADTLVDRLARTGGLRLRVVQADTVLPGRLHQRLVQLHDGLPVHGGELARQLHGGLTVSVFGTLYDDIDVDTTPTLSSDAAGTVIQARAGAPLNPTATPVLTVLPQVDGTYILTYEASVFADNDLRRYVVDAHSGAIVDEYSQLLKQGTVGTGIGVLGDRKKIAVTPTGGVFLADDSLRPADVLTYDMRGDVGRVRRVLLGTSALTLADLAADVDNVWEDPAGVDGHVYSGWTYDYFFRSFGRRGVDGNNLRIISLVHPVRRDAIRTASAADIDLFYLNAFYCPGCGEDGNGILVYGEGLPDPITIAGSNVRFFAGALDIIAHELTHAITFFTSRLDTRKVPGALNEAFSDIMGTSVEFFFQEPGDGPLKADYLVGEDIISPPLAGINRSLEDPQRFGDRDHLSRLFTGFADNGGVHTNSTIASHAFYLAIEGGTNRTSGVRVRGVGAARRQQVAEAFFRAFAFMLPSSATFGLARAATLQAALEVDPTGALQTALTEAWRAVGVN